MYDRICFFEVRIALEQKRDSFLLCRCPFFSRNHKGISNAREQFRYSVTIREPLWHKGLIHTNRLASTLVLLVLLATFEASLILFLELFIEEFTLFVQELLFLLLMFETEFLHGITYKLLHMESVKCYGSIRETFKYNLTHTFRKVHRDFTHFTT